MNPQGRQVRGTSLPRLPRETVPGAYFFFGGVVMPPICSHVPFATYFQSPGSLSLVAVPAHECEERLASCAPWVREPLWAWLTERWEPGGGVGFRYEVHGTGRSDMRVVHTEHTERAR